MKSLNNTNTESTLPNGVSRLGDGYYISLVAHPTFDPKTRIMDREPILFHSQVGDIIVWLPDGFDYKTYNGEFSFTKVWQAVKKELAL